MFVLTLWISDKLNTIRLTRMSSFIQVASVVNRLKLWSCTMCCKGRIKKDGPITNVNIGPLLNQNNTDVFINPLHPDSSFQFDDSTFIGASTETKKQLQIYMIQSARQAGFDLCYVSRLSRSKANRKTLASLYFRCRHGQVSDTDKGSVTTGNPAKRRRKHSTTFSTQDIEVKCTFNITLFCDAANKSWYLQFNKRSIIGQSEEEKTRDMSRHKGHLQVKPDTVRVQMKEIRNLCGGLIDAGGKAHVPQYVLGALASVNKNFNGSQVKTAQIAYFQSCHEDLSTLVSKLDSKMSSAERLLELMDTLIDQGDDLEYCALIHSSDHGFRIRQPKGRPPKKVNLSGQSSPMSIKDIRKSMMISDGQEVLLALAWASGEEKLLFQKYPHVIYADITEKTNIEKRSLFNFIGKDGNNRIFPCFHCYMPNSTVEQFHWVYDHAFPMVVGRKAIETNEVFITDGERNMYETVQNLADMTTSPWHGTKVFRCVYHLFYQPWQKKVMGRHQTSTEETYCKWAKQYIEYMMYNVQYEYQLIFFMREFEFELVGHAHLLPGTKMGIMYVWNAMKACPTKWARCFKRGVMDVDSRTTSPCESYHSTLKRHVKKEVWASASISKSATLALDHSDAMCKNRNRSMEKAVQCHPNCSPSNETAEYLTPYAERKSKDIFDRKNQYHVTRYAANKWLVMHKSGKTGRRSNADRDRILITSAFDVPVCTNTHNVTIDKSTQVMTCSCGLMKRLGLPCPHVGAVVNKRDPEMFHYRWFNLYSCTNIENKDVIDPTFDSMKKDQGGNFEGVHVGNSLGALENFKGISLSEGLDTMTAEFMLFCHVQHTNKVIVQKTEEASSFDFNKLQDTDLKQLYRFIYSNANLGLDSQSQDDDIMRTDSIETEDSDPHYLDDEDNRLTEKATKEDDMARYGKVQTLVHKLSKTCEGRPNLYDDFIGRLQSMAIEFDQTLLKEDRNVREDTRTNDSSTMVSSNLPIECTPNRGRYKSSHER